MNALTEDMVTEIDESRSKSQEKLANYLDMKLLREEELKGSSSHSANSYSTGIIWTKHFFSGLY